MKLFRVPARTVKKSHACRTTTYFGGAGGDGTYQALINLVPPHETYISLFAGHCAVRRHMRAPSSTYLFDLDPQVITWWEQWKKDPANLVARGAQFSVMRKDALDVLDEPWLTTAAWLNTTFIFVDPPYPDAVCRTSAHHRYRYPFTDAQHVKMCQVLHKDYKECKVMIRTIENKIYDKYLKGWKKVFYMNTTRSGQVQECVYLNYDAPLELHDYSHLGTDYEDRRRIKVKIRRHVNRLRKLPPRERNAIVKAIQEYSLVKNIKQ